MAAYKVYFKASAQKELESIPRRDLLRIIERIDRLADDPRAQGAEKLSGQERYRVRQGNYRIVYSIQDAVLTVWVVKIVHRREVYRT